MLMSFKERGQHTMDENYEYKQNKIPVNIKWKTFHKLTFLLSLFLFLLLIFATFLNIDQKTRRPLNFADIFGLVFIYLLMLPFGYIAALSFYGLTYQFIALLNPYYREYFINPKKSIMFFPPLVIFFYIIISLFLNFNNPSHKIFEYLLAKNEFFLILLWLFFWLGVIMNLLKIFLIVLNISSGLKEFGVKRSILVCFFSLFLCLII
jgi:uncharacterized membrane protein YciS (DUF1049 family)